MLAFLVLSAGLCPTAPRSRRRLAPLSPPLVLAIALSFLHRFSIVLTQPAPFSPSSPLQMPDQHGSYNVTSAGTNSQVRRRRHHSREELCRSGRPDPSRHLTSVLTSDDSARLRLSCPGQ